MLSQLEYKRLCVVVWHWLYRQRTQASVAHAVVIQRKKIACHKVISGVRRIAIPQTLL